MNDAGQKGLLFRPMGVGAGGHHCLLVPSEDIEDAFECFYCPGLFDN